MLPLLVLDRIFEHVLRPDEDGSHSLDTIMDFASLRNTCSLFRSIADTSLKLETIKITSVKKDMLPLKSNVLSSVISLFVGSGTDAYFYRSIRRLCLLHAQLVIMLEVVKLNFVDLTREEECKVLGQISKEAKATLIKINSGWIIDGFIIARPGCQVIHGGTNLGGSQHVFVLGPEELLTDIEGTHCYFDNRRVTGQVTLITNQRRIGPFGYSGNPNGSEEHLIYNRFSLPIDHVKLGNDWRTNLSENKYLAPITIR